MAINMKRCGSCHDVFEATGTTAACPSCGAPYQPPVSVLPPGPGSFVERYQGTAYSVPTTDTVIEAAPRSGLPLLLGLGVVMVVVAVALGGLLLMGAFGASSTPSPRPTSNIVVARTPTPTLPQAVYQTLTALTDPMFSAKVVVDSSVTVSARIASSAGTARSHLETTIYGADEIGTLITTGRLTYQFYVTNSAISYRLMPSGKWTSGAILSYLILSPMFDLTQPQQLQMIQQTQKNGQAVYHLQSTAFWRPDVFKLAVMGSSVLDGFHIQGGALLPDHYLLDLYVTYDGLPVYAEFEAWTAAGDGVRVLDLKTTYTFTDVGTTGPIASPSGL
jgi:hypothetical protein